MKPTRDPALNAILSAIGRARGFAEVFGGAAILTLLGSIIAAVGAMNYPVLGVIGAVIAGVGAIWSARDQNEASRKLDAKNEEIVRLTREIAHSVTGGPGACYLMPYGGGSPGAMVIVIGDYPLYEVTARIVDLEEFNKVKDRGFFVDRPNSSEQVITLGTLIPHSSAYVGKLFNLHGESRSWNIFFSARNGFFTQLLRMRKIDGKWISALRVTRNDRGTQEQVELLEKIPDNFGSIKWQ